MDPRKPDVAPLRPLHEPVRIVTLTREQVRALDRYAIEELGIPGLVLMENAAAAIEEALLLAFAPVQDDFILIACGPGNNGGDGLALARRLHNRGFAHLAVGLARAPERFTGDAATNLHIGRRLGVRIEPLDVLLAQPRPAIIIDALFGTGLDRPLAGADADAVEAINNHARTGARVLAIDVPSGMDADTGEALGGVAVTAEVTCTLAARKPGLATPSGGLLAGQVFVGDIGVLPPARGHAP